LLEKSINMVYHINEVKQMKFSTKGRYALRIMVDIALNGAGGYISLKEISERQGISKKYLEQIVPVLSRAKLLKTVRGYQGGYALARAPEEITVGDVLRAAEGSLAPVACLDDEENLCERCDVCKTLYVWEGLFKVMTDYVDSITVRDVAEHNCC
jgi:Rrf2 family protein